MENKVHQIADTVSNETSLSFAFITGIIEDGVYTVKLPKGTTQRWKITTNEKSGLRKYTYLNS